MMRIAIALALIAAAVASADAKAYKLQDFSVDDVKARCTKVHGEFFVHDDGTYGCKYSKGTVQCDKEQHCGGVLKEVQHHREHHATPHPHHREYREYPRYREYRWYPYQQW